MANATPDQIINLGPNKSTGVGGGILHNAEMRSAKIETVDEAWAVEKTTVKFQVIAREAAFTDTTIANYQILGQDASWNRYARNEGARRYPPGRGELTTRLDSVTPKTLAFDIIFRADATLSPNDIKKEIMKLQSLCYPRFEVGLNPPLCRITVLDLYSLECYVTQVLVTWTNYWHLPKTSDQGGLDLPMGADISMGVLMHQYPTREAVLKGSTFHTKSGTGYAGIAGEGAYNRIGVNGE